MVLTQLAFDDEVFEQKLVDRELFYYTHEKQYENERRVHYVLVDGSASMRGVREVFARGLALALCKRLALLGEEVILRFFDSRLYEGRARLAIDRPRRGPLRPAISGRARAQLRRGPAPAQRRARGPAARRPRPRRWSTC